MAHYVLRGSNHVFEYVLPLFSPWPYKGMQNELFPMVETIEAGAGDLVIYLDKTLHGSHINFSSDSRPVVHFGALHPDVELQFYSLDEKRQEVKVYAVPPRFYFDKDFASVENKYPFVREFKFDPPSLSADEVKAKLKEYKEI